MLKELRIGNYRSINEEQIFTMEACSKNEISEYPDHVLEIKDERILKVSSFYGPNGGGKTNLIKAIMTISQIIRGAQINNDARGNANYMPCLLNEKKNNESKFDIFFVRDDMEIGYSLVVDLSKTKKITDFANHVLNVVDVEIIKEEMVYRVLGTKDYIPVFNRNPNGVVDSKMISSVDLISASRPLQKSNSFVNYIVTTFGLDNKEEEFKPIINFATELSSIFYLNKETHFFIFTKEVVDFLTPYLEKTTKLLNGFDIRIKGLHFAEVEPGNYCLFVDREDKKGDTFSIQLNCESSGTRKIINIILDVISFEEGSIFLADDFDSHLHPKLIKTLIELFTSKANTNKQLIFNSHDITNMNNKVFRRDEIWFAFKNEDGMSTKYMPLSNIVDYKGNMVRKDAVYGKQYLEGKYGADPFIKKGLEWTND